MILDVLQSPLGIDLAIAPTDRILGGELVVVTRIIASVVSTLCAAIPSAYTIKMVKRKIVLGFILAKYLFLWQRYK